MYEPTFQTATARTWHLQTAATSGGTVHEQRVEYVPGSPFPATHYHPDQDEHIEVEHGAMEFVVAGRRQIVPAGRSIDIRRGTPHRARNATDDEPAVVRWETRPALRTTEFLGLAARLESTGGLLDRALLAWEYQDVFRLAGPTAGLVPLLGRLARLRGRRLPP